MNKLKTALNLFFLVILTTLLHTPVYSQGQSKVWIGLDQSILGDAKIFKHTFTKEGFFDFDTSNNWMCVKYGSSYHYMVETGLLPKTLTQYINDNNLQAYEKIICEKVSGFMPCIAGTALCLNEKKNLANQISKNINQLKDKTLGLLAEIDASISCLEGGEILNNNAVKFSNTNLFYYCVKDEDGIHKVNLCEAGQTTCKDIKSIKDQPCNLAVSEKTKCDYLSCLGKSSNELKYQDAIAGPSGVTTKERKLFCLPSDNYTESQKIVCSSEIRTPNGREVVNYKIASDSINNSSSMYKGVCKFQDQYLAEGPSRSLKEDISGQLASNDCSLSLTFDDEMSKTDKVNCSNPGQCVDKNLYSKGTEENIFCIESGNDFTKGVKYVCKNSYKFKGDSWVPCLTIATTSIQNYEDAMKAINLSGDFCGSEPPCKKLDAYFEEFKEQITLNRTVSRLLPLGYTQILQRLSQLLYATAVFLFVLLMIINGIHLVRSGNSPEELKKAKEGIFKTIAGFLFVVFSGGFIISIINSMQQMSP